MRPLRETDILWLHRSSAGPASSSRSSPASCSSRPGRDFYLVRRAPAPPSLAFSDFLQQVEAGRRDAGPVRRRVDRRHAEGRPRCCQTFAPREFLSAERVVRDRPGRAADIRVDVHAAGRPDVAELDARWPPPPPSSRCSASRSTARPPAAFPRCSRTGARRRAGDNVVTFQDVAGVDEAKDEVKEIVDFLREPGRFSAIGGRIPKGVLLVGPPGTGKTLLARSIAGEAGVPFLFASGSDFVEMYAGVGAVARPPAVPRRAPPPVLHHLHRRARRRRPQPRRQLAQPRRARADAQPAARRDGRLRRPPGHRRHRRDQPPGHPRSGAAPARAASIGRSRSATPI